MLRFFASACLLGGLAGCGAPPRATAAVHAPPIVADQAVHWVGERGTILATRPVPSTDPRPVWRLLARLGGGPPTVGTVEFIVRREDGGLLAVVQPAAPGLRTGRQVLILPGMPARIGPLPSVAER